MANFHIIGTGLAGLAAATMVARAGHYVQLYESGTAAGGRCALLRDEHRNDGYDGCNAMLFGGNQIIRRYAEQIGSAHTLMLLDAGGDGYDVKRKEAFSRAAFLLPPALPVCDAIQLFRMRFASKGTAADDLFDYYHPLTETYIEPLCRSLMLSDAQDADAKTIARRVWNIAKRGKQGLRMMVPRTSLYHSLIEPALLQIEHEGGSIYYGHALKKLSCRNGAIDALHFAKQVKTLRADDRVIIALPAHALQQIAPDALQTSIEQRDVLSVHFHRRDDRASRIIPLTGACVDWVREHAGVVTAVSYTPQRLLGMHDESIARRVWADIMHALGYHEQPLPSYRVVRNRRAHAVTGNAQPLPNRYHANGFLAGEIFGPSTHVPLEAAIISGIAAAEAALASGHPL